MGMSSNTIHKTYNSIAELPTEVRSSFDETDQKKWMDYYNEESDGKSDEDTVKRAKETAWTKMMDSPSGLAVETWGTVESKDADGEVVNVDTVRDHSDMFINHGGHMQTDHSNVPIGTVWKYEERTHPETGTPGIVYYLNLFRDNEVSERARDEILSGEKRSVSIGAEAPRGEYKCDDLGCYVERNVTDLFELSLCASPANYYANFISINGKNVAKSRKGDITIKIHDMTVHKDYNTCPLQNVKRNLVKAGADAHILANDHITVRGITKDTMLDVLDKSVTDCRWKATAEGFEIKLTKTSRNILAKSMNKAMIEDMVDYIYQAYSSGNGYWPVFDRAGQYMAYCIANDQQISKQEFMDKVRQGFSERSDRFLNDAQDWLHGYWFANDNAIADKLFKRWKSNVGDSTFQEFILSDIRDHNPNYKYKARYMASVRKATMDVDPSAEIEQCIEEAIKNGWAYRSNGMVLLQKECTEGFFKDMYDRGYLQCVSGYWQFKADIIAKEPMDKEGGSMGAGSAGASNAVYGKKPESLVIQDGKTAKKSHPNTIKYDKRNQSTVQKIRTSSRKG